jgi:hypothetical protein
MNTSPEKPSRSPILSPMSSPEMYPLSDEENYMDFDSSDFSLDYIDDSLFNLFIGTRGYSLSYSLRLSYN